MLIPKVLVANRGEIAIRILRSAKELGWGTVALCTTVPTLDVSHATYADEVCELPDVALYTNVQAILEIAVRTHCTHVHPGYGFLSESPALADALAKCNPPITFIGPSSDTLRLAGDKMLSRKLAACLDVQVAPGTSVVSSDEVRTFAARHDVGYPIMIKALDGGGGRGIRIVGSAEAVDEAVKRCKGESLSSQVFAEKALTGPGWKHIEVQVIGDGSGAVNHMWERECSIQRRFQKIIEMAPSRLPRLAVQPLINASLKIAAHLKYKGLGTFEYLVNATTHQWVFLEINPRIQVEHTVTEEIMDIDLVRAQFLLFAPTSPTNTLSSLSLYAPPHLPTSHAIQFRLTAENPENGLSLTPGSIRTSDIQWPASRGVRIDTWLSYLSSQPLAEWVIGTDFDSLLAKIIVRDQSFEDCTQKAQRALREFRLAKECKIKTNITVLAGVLEHQDWHAGTIDTLWLERNLDEILRLGKAAMARQREESSNGNNAIGSQISSGTLLLQPGSLFHLALSPAHSLNSSSPQETVKHVLTLTSISNNSFPEKLSGVLQSTLSPSPLAFSLSQATSAVVGSGEGFELANPNDTRHIASPLSGKIVDIHPAIKFLLASATTDEDKRMVKKGEMLAVMSVMKMENSVIAPYDGVIERAGKGLKISSIIGEGMLVCVLNPTRRSRL
ncbi:hypothetical protein AGABI1DRAFT_78556 [Agaricus bisporus var. burnettii JB137-S8]|uniref:Pyruvate carboxylase n=1 Tax=Agaricus bisporus var. burnettii (strain JB137-S8 / ATCC MYA-4627 / FGSC 10392) TaxID=597362 RepID=K5X019_AGABU|nr:uncharacterized protein AGABI1DRAFT_78556 [Agaricus bisporus var. burnettii JB137-S8]EKM76463.1 hypothetical protein AGABI1DRAFT_78556 [Agaricus bisporus var. burnettii JB137-S8]